MSPLAPSKWSIMAMPPTWTCWFPFVSSASPWHQPKRKRLSSPQGHDVRLGCPWLSSHSMAAIPFLSWSNFASARLQVLSEPPKPVVSGKHHEWPVACQQPLAHECFTYHTSKIADVHAMPRRFPKVPRPQWIIFEGTRLRFSGTQGKERMVKTQLRLVNL